MEDVILIIAVAAVMVFGFFIMKRLDVFLNENKKQLKRNEKKNAVRLNSLIRKIMRI